MRVIFIGSVLFSEKCLIHLIDLNANIVGVITKKKSDFNSDFVDLSITCAEYNIPFYHTSDINNSETLNWTKSRLPDVIFCFGWSSLLKKNILELPSKGVVGFHPTLLPKNRGRHPLIWAKALGLKKTGCTFFFMDENADTGDILSQKVFDIEFEDCAASLYKKMVNVALMQISDFLPKLAENTYFRIKQNYFDSNSWRKRNKNDGFIDFRMNSESICNLVRALTTPYVGAHCNYKGGEFKVWEVEMGNNVITNNEPGKVICVDSNKIEVKSGSGSIIITRHGFEELPKKNDYLL